MDARIEGRAGSQPGTREERGSDPPDLYAAFDKVTALVDELADGSVDIPLEGARPSWDAHPR